MMFQRQGRGVVPLLDSLVDTAGKQLIESPHAALHAHRAIGRLLDYSVEGCSADEVSLAPPAFRRMLKYASAAGVWKSASELLCWLPDVAAVSCVGATIL